MSSKTKPSRLMFLDNLAHYLTAFVIFLKGIDKIDLGKPVYGSIFIFIALVIVFGTIFHHRAERALKHFKGYVMMLEAVVMTIVGYLYMKDGKQMIQYACFATAIMFTVATIIYFRKHSKRTVPKH